MSGMSEARKAKKGIVPTPREMTPEEVLELQQLNFVVGNENFKADQMEKNTALIPDGQKAAETQRAIAQILTNYRTEWLADKLGHLGYTNGEQVSIDTITGAVTRL